MIKIKPQCEIIRRLRQLTGVWEGRGFAQFPTIEPADYVERLTFNANEKEFLIFYEQQTWKSKDLNDRSDPLHWQAGFIMVSEDGAITLNNAQNSGRTEVLKGEMWVSEPSANDFELHFASAAFSNDPRMISSSRIYRAAHETLHYTLAMAIQAEPLQQTHLTCRLRRIQTL